MALFEHSWLMQTRVLTRFLFQPHKLMSVWWVGMGVNSCVHPHSTDSQLLWSPHCANKQTPSSPLPLNIYAGILEPGFAWSSSKSTNSSNLLCTGLLKEVLAGLLAGLLRLLFPSSTDAMEVESRVSVCTERITDVERQPKPHDLLAKRWPTTLEKSSKLKKHTINTASQKRARTYISSPLLWTFQF